MLTSVFYKKNIHVTDLHPSNNFVVSVHLYWPGGFFNALAGQARNQDFMWGGANEAKADPTTEMYFLSSDPFI